MVPSPGLVQLVRTALYYSARLALIKANLLSAALSGSQSPVKARGYARRHRGGAGMAQRAPWRVLKGIQA